MDWQPGDRLVVQGQLYRMTGQRQHECKDGRMTDLLVFRSACVDCGDKFETLATRRSVGKGWLNRRCDACKRPGHKAPRGSTIVADDDTDPDLSPGGTCGE